MKTASLLGQLHPKLYKCISRFTLLRPAQEKAVRAGLLQGKNLLVCTPTASGKTLIAEIAVMQSIFNKKGKAVYIVPLKALATEKYQQFKELYKDVKVAVSIGDADASEPYLEQYDLIITTSEKLDSLIRHKASFVSSLATIIIDEIHLLNDIHRGPTLEMVITMLRRLLTTAQFIGLSATIGNPHELGRWLDAEVVEHDWRPVKLKKGIYMDGEIVFYS